MEQVPGGDLIEPTVTLVNGERMLACTRFESLSCSGRCNYCFVGSLVGAILISQLLLNYCFSFLRLRRSSSSSLHTDGM